MPALARLLGLLVVASLVLSACADGVTEACTLVGPGRVVQVLLPAGTPDRLGSLELTLCQRNRCASAEPAGHRGGVYDFTEPAAHSWDPDATTRVTVVGRSATGAVVLRSEDSFHFTQNYPNGRRCDAEYPGLSHRIAVPMTDVL